MKFLVYLMLLGSAPAVGQTAPNVPPANPAAWLAQVQQMPFSAQVAALRERLRADAGRTYANDASQMPACIMAFTPEQRAAQAAQRQIVADTVVWGYRVLCVVNGQPLNGPEAAAAVEAVPAQNIRRLAFITGGTAAVIYGSRAGAGVVLVEVAK